MPYFSLEPLEPRTLFAAFTPTLVKELTPGFAGSFITEVTAVGDRAFFVDSANHDLWKSNGASSGTVKVKDGQVFGSMYGLGNLFALGDKVLFTAYDGTRDGMYLWVSDGTSSGTKPLAYLADAFSPGYTLYGAEANGTLIFAAPNAGNAWVLWRSNGTAAGTQVVKVLTTDVSVTRPQNFVAAGNRVFFTADNGVHGNELWTSNGTAVGTYMLKDLLPGEKGSMSGVEGHADYAVVGGLLYFVADNPNLSDRLWVTNGTRAGTRPKMLLGLTSSHLTAVGNQLYYFNGFDLYRTAGTLATRVKVADVRASNAVDEELAVVGDRLFFGGQAGDSEPWVGGGTPATASRVANISLGGSSSPTDFHRVGGYVMFVANSQTHGREIYVTAGTEASTRRLGEIRAGTATPWIDEVTVVGNRVFFTADDGGRGEELWSFTVPSTVVAAVAPAAAPADAAVAAAALRDHPRAATARPRDEESGDEATDGFDLLDAFTPVLSWSR